MDPISQGVLGAVAATSCASPQRVRLAALVGCVGGMLADADVLIGSANDPLLNVEFHRHFSHSLLFIPLGGLVAATLLWPFLRLFRHRLPFPSLYLFATLGYATSGLLDACTSYGTHLLWPFSNARAAWNIISIVDPVFTIGLLAIMGAAVVKARPSLARFAGFFALAYLSLGVLQNTRAYRLQATLLSERGHTNADMLTVKPSLGNLVLWRSVYRHQDRFHVDALRVGFLSAPRVYPGDSLPAFNPATLSPAPPADSPLAEDLRRFAHFSENYLALDSRDPALLVDLRYSSIPNSLAPLWAIRIDPDEPDRHAAFETFRQIDEQQRQSFIDMLRNRPNPPSRP